MDASRDRFWWRSRNWRSFRPPSPDRRHRRCCRRRINTWWSCFGPTGAGLRSQGEGSGTVPDAGRSPDHLQQTPSFADALFAPEANRDRCRFHSRSRRRLSGTLDYRQGIPDRRMAQPAWHCRLCADTVCQRRRARVTAWKAKRWRTCNAPYVQDHKGNAADVPRGRKRSRHRFLSRGVPDAERRRRQC